MKPLLSAVALAALITVPSTADAKVWKSIKGVTYFSDQVWTNQLNGDPVVEFPKGCQGSACEFTIWLDYDPGIGVEASENCQDDPSTDWFDCEPFPNCRVWVEFGDRVMPLTDWHARTDDDEFADNAVIAMIWDNSWSTQATGFVWNGHEAFHGADYKLLHIIAGEVDIYDKGLCRVGIAALYYPARKTLFENGYLLPR